MAALESTAIDLVQAAISNSTTNSYNTTLSQLHAFLADIDPRYKKLPVNAGQIVLFIAHLYQNGLTSATIYSKMSAISYYHKLMGLPDIVSNFVVQKALAGVKRMASSSDGRLPITLGLLEKLIDNVRLILSGDHYVKLLKAMMCLSFYAFLRPGEVTASGNNIMFMNVQLSRTEITLTFVAFKHHKGKPVTILIPAQSSAICPVQLLAEYICVRGAAPGPLFCHPCGRPISYAQFYNWFHSLLKCVHVNHLYGLHSFRLGAATLAASRNVSSVLIQQMGRWRSNAYTRYIRTPVVRF